jgi:hypothetical protein
MNIRKITFFLILDDLFWLVLTITFICFVVIGRFIFKRTGKTENFGFLVVTVLTSFVAMSVGFEAKQLAGQVWNSIPFIV